MPNVSEVVDALRSALNKKGVECHLQDAFDHLASFLVLLNSSSPSVQMIQKLCDVLRKPLLPLYTACLQPALQFSSSVLSTILGNLCDTRNGEDERFRSAWDETARVILSGVLDFLDQNDTENLGSEGVAWEALCRILCEFFFLDSGRDLRMFSIPLCLSAYNILTETAARQTTVRNALCLKAVLGGERLGAAISKTRDYLILEALLMLFARLLPPVHGTSQGMSKRVEFVKEVLGSSKLFKCSAKLLDIMQNASSRHWDDIAALIIDALAESDITYPQPFSIDEIAVCGEVFPQPLVTDRLIMDKQAFFANIVGDNVICESLEVPYSCVRTITLDNSEENVPKGRVLIMVYLTSPPLVGNIEMKVPDESLLHAKFFLQSDVIGRFMEALRRRGVGKLNFLNSLAKVPKKRKGISIGSALRFIDDSSPTPPPASFAGKIQHVNQVYKTDVEETQEAPMLRLGDANFPPVPGPQPAFGDEALVLEPLESVAVEDIPQTVSDTRAFSPTRGTPIISRITSILSPIGMQLFGANDILSEISEFESEDNMENVRTVTRVSTSCNRQNATHDGVRIKGSSATAATGTKKPPDSVPKTLNQFEGVSQKPPKNVKRPLTSNSPMSSSTQIDISLMLLSNADTTLATVEPEVAGSLFATSHHSARSDELNKSVDHCKPSNGGLVIGSSRKDQIETNSTENRIGRHQDGRITPSANHSRKETVRDTSIPPKIAGNRRKRERIKSSGKVVIEIDDESTPPRKKSRDDVALTSRTKGCSMTAKGSSPSTDPTIVDFDDLPVPAPVQRGTRRSSRIKKRQKSARVGIRVAAMRSKTRKRDQVDGQSVSDIECDNLAPQDPIVKIARDAAPASVSHVAPTLCRKSPLPELTCDMPVVELRSGESISPRLSWSVPKATSIRYESSQHNVTHPEIQRDIDVAYRATSNTMPFAEEVHVKTKETANDQLLLSDLRFVENTSNPAQEMVAYSLSPKAEEALLESLRPVVGSTPPTETVTVNLAVANSLPRNKGGLHCITLGRSETGTQTGPGTPDQSDCIVAEEHALSLSLQRKRRTVTFASPIEYTPERHHPSPVPSESEGNILSPITISRGTVHPRHKSSDQLPSQVKWQKSEIAQGAMRTPARDQTADEVEIQDIVEVLNEIQAVIIKGISNRFKNIKKDVQHGRDELIRQVLDELQSMAVENAEYFNELVRFEEDYYENGKVLTRCWEELIECNDSITSHLRNAMTEHDLSISAKTFPKSLLRMKPVSLCRVANPR